MPIPGLLRANRNIRNIGQEKNPPVAVMSVVAVEALAFEWPRVLLRHHGDTLSKAVLASWLD
jgi:hypothetical protein